MRQLRVRCLVPWLAASITVSRFETASGDLIPLLLDRRLVALEFISGRGDIGVMSQQSPDGHPNIRQ